MKLQLALLLPLATSAFLQRGRRRLDDEDEEECPAPGEILEFDDDDVERLVFTKDSGANCTCFAVNNIAEQITNASVAYFTALQDPDTLNTTADPVATLWNEAFKGAVIDSNKGCSNDCASCLDDKCAIISFSEVNLLKGVDLGLTAQNVIDEEVEDIVRGIDYQEAAIEYNFNQKACFAYIGGAYNDATHCWDVNVNKDANSCEWTVNGDSCASCSVVVCDDEGLGLDLDCTNLLGANGTMFSCDETTWIDTVFELPALYNDETEWDKLIDAGDVCRSDPPPMTDPPTPMPVDDMMMAPTEGMPTEQPSTEGMGEMPTEAPPTEAEAPPTETAPTEAPPTEAPPTDAEAPPTEAPPTEAPPTEAPPTNAESTSGAFLPSVVALIGAFLLC